MDMTYQNLELLQELKKLEPDKNNKTGAVIAGAAVTGLVGAKLLSSGKFAGLAFKAGKAAKVAKSGTGIMVIDPNKKTGDTFKDHVIDTISITLRSTILSLAISTLTYAIYAALSEEIDFTLEHVFKMFVKIGLTISIAAIVFKVLQQILEKVIKFNDGKPLSQDQNATLVTLVIGVIIFEIETKLYEINSDQALTAAIISALMTFLINSTLIPKMMNYLIGNGKNK